MKFLHHFSSPVQALSRQLGETQQMVTSLNFTSNVAPLEDLIICGPRALLLMLHSIYVSLSLLQLHWVTESASAHLKHK